MHGPLATLGILLLAASAHAADGISVYSPRADSVSITIYRDFFALITETREVDLPAEPVTLVFQNVVETLIPQSAVLNDADRAIAESNYTFDPLTPASLIKHSIGETVTLTRTNPATGKVSQVPATVVAAGGGVVFRLADGHEALHCSGLPERLVFSKVPDELTAKPTLSIRLAAGKPGKRTIRLSYIAPGFTWDSDYVGRLNSGSDRMALTGWVTLDNLTNATFLAASVQFVAGRLNLIDAEEGGTRQVADIGSMSDDELQELKADFPEELRERLGQTPVDIFHCFSTPMPLRLASASPLRSRSIGYMLSPPAELEEVVVTAQKRAVRESFGDYQLYRLPWPTDLKARQTKQAVFLSRPAVKIERFYGFRLTDLLDQPDDEQTNANLMVRWENTEASGLGEPLPRGHVRFFEPYGSTEVFAGEAQIEDKAVGLPVELTIGRALNLTLQIANNDRSIELRHRGVTDTTVHLVNGKAAPISFEFRHGLAQGWTGAKVTASSQRAGKKYGDWMWRFTVPAGGQQDLHYSLSAKRAE
jgi:hypothetical protein